MNPIVLSKPRLPVLRMINGRIALNKTACLALAWCLVASGLLLWLTPLPGGIFLIRWGIMFACKASPRLRLSLTRHLHKIWLGSRLLPV